MVGLNGKGKNDCYDSRQYVSLCQQCDDEIHMEIILCLLKNSFYRAKY